MRTSRTAVMPAMKESISGMYPMWVRVCFPFVRMSWPKIRADPSHGG